MGSTWVDVGGRRIHTRWNPMSVASARPPIVLVHGWGVSGGYFTPTAERLAQRGYTVYVPDLPGHGKSDTADAPLDIAGLADVLVGWLDAMGIDQADWVGHSMGCQMVVDVSVRYPSRVRRLALMGPTTDSAHCSAPAQFFRALYACAFDRPGLLYYLMTDYLRMGTRLWPEALAMLRDPVEEKLAKLTQPVLLMRGQYDAIAPQRWLERAAQRARAERVVTIPKWGHNINYSAPDAVVAELCDFLDPPGS